MLQVNINGQPHQFAEGLTINQALRQILHVWDDIDPRVHIVVRLGPVRVSSTRVACTLWRRETSTHFVAGRGRRATARLALR